MEDLINMMQNNEKIIIELTKNEALILYDWIQKLNTKEDTIFEDQAEERVLWDLEAILEKKLTGPLQNNYHQLISEARESVRD